MTIAYCKVRVNVSALVADGLDDDDEPDLTPITGSLTIRPMLGNRKVLIHNNDGELGLKVIAPYKNIALDAFGNIAHRGRDYIKVAAPTSVETNIASPLQWAVTFENVKYGGEQVAIDTIYFYAHPDQDVNLAEHVSVAPDGSAVLLTRGPRGFGVVEAKRVGANLVLTFESSSGPVDSSSIPIPGGDVEDEAVAALISDLNSSTYEALTDVLDDRYSPLGGAALPSGGSTGQVLTKGEGGSAIWANPTGGGSGGSTAWADITGKPSTYPPTIGSSSTQAVAGNDSRLTNARTPVSHQHSVADIAAIGTPSSSTYLRGDGQWSTPAGGAGGSTAWNDVTGKPAVIAAGATQAAARSAIGAGTSNLAIGTGATEAVAGNDPRLSDQRVPVNGSVTIAKISATGSASAATFLRGDGTWSAAAGGGAANYARVIVVTGTEERPDVEYVDWIGGSAQPLNMIEGDIWYETAPAVDATAPSVPTGLTSSSITASSFILTWTASTDAVGVTGYEVRVNSGSAITVSSGTSHAFSGLSASTLYSAQVRARDAAGNWSAWSTGLNVTTSASSDVTAPTVPVGLASSDIGSTGFTVSWTASTDAIGVTGYEVFIGGVSYATPTGTSQAITGRTPSTTYSITVRARDAAGNWSAQSTPLSVTTGVASSDPWINRTLQTSARNGSTTHNLTFTPATTGSLLMMVASAPAIISTPAGWTRRTQVVNNVELSVYTKTASSGESAASLTLSAPNYPVAAVVFEFAAGATWGAGISGSTAGRTTPHPTLTGLTGTNLAFGAQSQPTSNGQTTGSTEWTTPVGIEEDTDVYVPFAATDGLNFSVGHVENFTGATFTPTGLMTATGDNLIGPKEVLTFTVKLA